MLNRFGDCWTWARACLFCGYTKPMLRRFGGGNTSTTTCCGWGVFEVFFWGPTVTLYSAHVGPRFRTGLVCGSQDKVRSATLGCFYQKIILAFWCLAMHTLAFRKYGDSLSAWCKKWLFQRRLLGSNWRVNLADHRWSTAFYWGTCLTATQESQAKSSKSTKLTKEHALTKQWWSQQKRRPRPGAAEKYTVSNRSRKIHNIISLGRESKAISRQWASRKPDCKFDTYCHTAITHSWW